MLRSVGGVIPVLAVLNAATVVPPLRAKVSVPPLILAAQRHLSSTHSYRQVSTLIITAGSKSPISVTGTTIVLIRNGNRTRVYLASTDAKGTAVAETVDTGTRICTRSTTTPSWSCHSGHSISDNYSHGVDLTVAYGEHLWVTPLKAQMKWSQMCLAYALSNHTTALPIIGELWIAAASKYPVERDITLTQSYEGRSSSGASRTVWSNENDPNLTIPDVPASSGLRL